VEAEVDKKIALFTIGFTKKTAEQFFNILKNSGVKRVVDIRLNNVSQLAGFAKRDDLRYFLKTICDIDYIYKPELAPTKDIMDEYKKNKGGWSVYEKGFRDLLSERDIENRIAKEILHGDCFLCSEEKPDRCHRSLVAEYLREKWGNIEIKHLE